MFGLVTCSQGNNNSLWCFCHLFLSMLLISHGCELRMFKGSALVQGAGKLMSNFQCAARFEMMISYNADFHNPFIHTLNVKQDSPGE